MIKRIAALIFIFACTSMAWFILGGTIFARSESQGPQLRGSVASTWGGAQEQTPPAASYPVTRDHVIYSHLADGTQTSRTEKETVPQPLPLDSTDARVNLQLEHRQKGLLWYSTYKVSFDATYSFTNPTQEPQVLTFRFSFPSEKAIYDDFVMTVNGTPLAFRTAGSTTIASTLVAAGQPAELRIAYRSQGMDSWHYNFGKDVTSVRNFRLQMTTNFHEISFEDNTLSPTDKQRTASGYLLTWAYSNLLSGFQIGVPMPEKLQPGPLAGEISLFAPVSLFFFFFIMFIITTMRNIEMHPMTIFPWQRLFLPSISSWPIWWTTFRSIWPLRSVPQSQSFWWSLTCAWWSACASR